MRMGKSPFRMRNNLLDHVPDTELACLQSGDFMKQNGHGHKGNSCIGLLVIFCVVLGAIAVGVFIFAPEKLPSGVGLKPLPVTVNKRPSLLTLGKGSVAVITNEAPETLYNVKVVCKGTDGKTKDYFKEAWPPKDTFEIGPLQGWVWASGETLEISVSGYLPRFWSF